VELLLGCLEERQIALVEPFSHDAVLEVDEFAGGGADAVLILVGLFLVLLNNPFNLMQLALIHRTRLLIDIDLDL